jgi:hypothetical protein
LIAINFTAFFKWMYRPTEISTQRGEAATKEMKREYGNNGTNERAECFRLFRYFRLFRTFSAYRRSINLLKKQDFAPKTHFPGPHH